MKVSMDEIKGEAGFLFSKGVTTMEGVLATIISYNMFNQAEAEEIAAAVFERIQLLNRIKTETDSFKESFKFYDWGHYGITDEALYDETKAALKQAIDSGKYFNTWWHGSKKEIPTMQIRRMEDGIEVCVHDEMDDVFDEYDLFYDFLTDEEMEMLDEDKADEIRDLLEWGDFHNEIDYTELLSSNASYDDVMATVAELEDDCERTLKNSFNQCIVITLHVLYDGNIDDAVIIERQKKFAE